MGRQSKGRRKLEIVKISKESNLLVTFSKRRYGVFKKASELAILCGAEITIIVFSPTMKVFSFGHPSVETVIDRFLYGNSTQTSGVLQLVQTHRNARVRDLNLQLTQVTTQLNEEKKRGEKLDQGRKAGDGQHWWESPIEELDLPKLEQLKTSLEMLRENVAKRVEELLIQTTNHTKFYNNPSLAPVHEALPFDPNNNVLDQNMIYDLGFPNRNGFF